MASGLRGICQRMGLISQDFEYRWISASGVTPEMIYAVAAQFHTAELEYSRRCSQRRRAVLDSSLSCNQSVRQDDNAALGSTHAASNVVNFTGARPIQNVHPNDIQVPRDAGILPPEEQKRSLVVVEPCTTDDVLGKVKPADSRSPLEQAIFDIARTAIEGMPKIEASRSNDDIVVENAVLKLALGRLQHEAEAAAKKADELEQHFLDLIEIVADELPDRKPVIQKIANTVKSSPVSNKHKRIYVVGLKGEQPKLILDKIKGLDVSVVFLAANEVGRVSSTSSQIDGVITCPKWMSHPEYGVVKSYGVPVVTAWGIIGIVEKLQDLSWTQ